MKALSDGTEVTSRSYYFLLDFNDHDNWNTIISEFKTNKLHELDKTQYLKLFWMAVKAELEVLKSQ